MSDHQPFVLLQKSEAPDGLRWAPGIAVRYADIGGVRLRYICTGQGPALVLLHTLRTQLDIFELMVPALAAHFTVYALDYPGHGFSDAPAARYDAAFFAAAVSGFLDRLDLRDATLAGISIGGVIPLLLSARGHPRIGRIVSINPYDYTGGLGLARSSPLGAVVTYTALIPILGEIVIPAAPRWLVRLVLEGGVADRKNLPAALSDDIYRAGQRPGAAPAFLKLLRNARGWSEAQREYGKVAHPVLLIWSDRDWSRAKERAQTAALIPGVEVKLVPRGGHFLSLDQPQEVARLINGFARR